MCLKDITDICMPRRDNENRLMVPPIIEVEFEKDTLDQHIITGRENILLQMKKGRPILFESCLQYGHTKKYCRSDGKLSTNFAELQF